MEARTRMDMDSLNAVLSEISPCDLDRPYVFVSYSSQDCGLVWRDVLAFQRAGYNVWLDEKNLDKTKESWKDDALTAIRDHDCRLLVFYVSASSLCSQPCLNELRETVSRDTRKIHGNEEVKFIAVDAEEVGDLQAFYRDVYNRRLAEQEAGRMTKAEFQRRVIVLNDILEEFFNTNNDRVRIHPKDEANRKGDYYSDILQCFPEQTRSASAGEAPPSKAPEAPLPPEDSCRAVPPGMEALLARADRGDGCAMLELCDYFWNGGRWKPCRHWAEKLFAQSAMNGAAPYALAYSSWMIARAEDSAEEWMAAEQYAQSARPFFPPDSDESKTLDEICLQSAEYLFQLYSRLLLAAEGGDPAAQYELGRQYTAGWRYALRFSREFGSSGEGTQVKVRNRAGRWFELAAAQTYPPAVCALGKCYDPEYGQYGVFRAGKDPQRALELYREAAGLGDAEAASLLRRYGAAP